MDGKFKLMAHQKFAIEAIEANDGLLINIGLGGGKTMVALAYIYKHLKRGDARDALVVCPASLVESWRQAIEELPKFEGFDSRAVELMKEKVTITSFQKTYRTTKKEIVKSGGQVTYQKIVTVRPEVDKRWSILVIDEAHQVSAHNATGTKTMITLAQMSGKIISLSGTFTFGGRGMPAYSKLYGEIQIASKGRAFRNWTEFRNKAIIAEDRFYNPLAYDEAYCKHLMENWMIVFRTEDCVDLPDKVETVVPCPLAEKKVYVDFMNGDYSKYNVDIKMAGGQYTKMLQIVSGSLKTEDSTLILKTSKDDALMDILSGTDDAVVVFCNYRASIDHAAAVARKAGRTVTVYDGRSRTETWKDFQAGKCDCIVMQYQSGGAGINLQRSHTMVLYEPCFSALLLTQALGRVYRTGQTKKVQYFFLVTPASLEMKVLNTVRSGKDVSEKVLIELAEGSDTD